MVQSLLLTLSILAPIVYLAYRIFHCRKELLPLPGISLYQSLEAFFIGKPYDITIEDYYDPVLKEKKIVRTWMQGEWAVIVSSPKIAKEIFMYPNKYPKNIPQDIFPEALFSKFMGVNVIFSNYTTWKRHRSVVNPPFHKQFEPKIFGQITNQFSKILLDKKGKDIDVFSYMQSITIDALGKAVLDVEFDAIHDPNAPFLNAYNNILSNSFVPIYLFFPFLDKPWNPFRAKVFDDLKWLQSYFDQILDERREEIRQKKDSNDLHNAHDDLLTLMIQSQEKDGLNNKELMDNILGFFLAGHETTACVLGVTLFFLAKYPEIQEKLYQEVRFLLKKPDTIPTIEQTKQMTYLFAIMEESLRLYPPVSRLPDRVCKEELHFDNYIIPKGTRLALSIYSLHRDPEIWGEDSNEFKPERFLDENMNEKELKTKFITNGFGGGSRICLGLNFSRLEQKVVLSMLVNKFKIKFSEKNCNRDRIKLTPHPILYPKELYLDFELRE